jgi:hypothetical protein
MNLGGSARRSSVVDLAVAAREEDTGAGAR